MQLAVYMFGLWDSSLLIELYSACNQLLVLKKHAVFTQLGLVLACKYAEGDLDRG